MLKRYAKWVILMTVTLSLVLAACAPAATPTEEAPPVEEPTEEAPPVEEPPEEEANPETTYLGRLRPRRCEAGL